MTGIKICFCSLNRNGLAMMSDKYKMQAPRQKPWMSTLRTLDWGLQKLKEMGSGSRGSPKNMGPLPKRAIMASVRLIPVMTHVSGSDF
jgi:hypothetical protein